MSIAPFIIAAGQMTSGDDLSANLATCRALAAEAAHQGADLLCLPECFSFLGRNEHAKFPIAEVFDERAPGPVLATLVQTARAHKMWILAGGTPERLDQERDLPAAAITRTYNTALVLSPGGQLVAKYRKIHLFDVDIPGGAQLRESDTTTSGDAPVLVDTPLAKLGLSICYDLRFPELYRQLVLEGAEILFVPAAFTAHTGAAHWHTLLRARAIENQCFVVAAAQSGRHNDRRVSHGHSQIIDAWGTTLAERESGTGVVVAQIDLETMRTTRARMPCLEHRALV